MSSADLFSSATNFERDNKSHDATKELAAFLEIEKQRAQFTAQIHEFSDICWDKCIDKPGAKLDGRTETCLSNCVNRFIDVSLFITNRFSQMLDKAS